MYHKWHGFLALASADYNYPCNITAGECYSDALAWWMLWEVKQSLLIIRSLRCYLDLSKSQGFLPWKGHRTLRNQCSASILPSALCSSRAWESCCPTVTEPLFSVLSQGLFLLTLRGEACFVLESFPALSLGLQRGLGSREEGRKKGRKAVSPGADRMAAAKEKIWGPWSGYPLNHPLLLHVYKQTTQASHWIQGFALCVKYEKEEEFRSSCCPECLPRWAAIHHLNIQRA